MENTVLKRNITENLKKWEESMEGPLFLYGLKGVGKAFTCREYASFHESFMYYEPEATLIKNRKSDVKASEHVASHFGICSEALGANLMIFNETEKAEEFFTELLETACDGKYKWIFISDYDYTGDRFGKALNKLQMFPVQFDEFLLNLGTNEWYVGSIAENLKRKEKLPDIVHNNLLSTFEEYLWTGGMPEVVKDYIHEYRLAIRSKQEDAKRLSLLAAENIQDASLKNKCMQIMDTVDDQLLKANRKFMFNMIRNGVTYQMYSGALDKLIERGMVLRINELSDERKFKLYYPEFSFNMPDNFDEITDVEFSLREENYILQTLRSKGIEVNFWESGNRAELPFVIRKNKKNIPVDYHGENKRISKSILSYRNKAENTKALIIADSNFVDDDMSVTIPVYSLFCIEKLLEVLF